MNLKQILELCWGDPNSIIDTLNLGIWVFKNEDTGISKFESFENIVNQIKTSNRSYIASMLELRHKILEKQLKGEE